MSKGLPQTVADNLEKCRVEIDDEILTVFER
jgi:hypothetical protein